MSSAAQVASRRKLVDYLGDTVVTIYLDSEQSPRCAGAGWPTKPQEAPAFKAHPVLLLWLRLPHVR